MLTWRPFDYTTLDDMREDISKLDIQLPLSHDISILGKSIDIYGKNVKNRVAIQPMEGFDAYTDGTPGELTFRRYRRFSAGGAGLIWFESIGCTRTGKSGPRQSMITESNAETFYHLLMEVRENAKDGKPPYTIGQITHSGRNARLKEGGYVGETILPYIAAENPYLPKGNVRILTDDEIEGVIDDYVKAAALMKQVGFDAVDIRSCHGYLLSEMLSAFTRTNSRYGGSFENRTRMLLTIVDRVREEIGIPIAIRLNACDLVPYPYGWGMSTDGSMTPDLSEPIELGRQLLKRGVRLMNLSLGRNHAGHIQSPSDKVNLYPENHQLASIAYFQDLAAKFKEALPDAIIMTGTFAWARQFAPNIAAGGIKAGRYDLAGFARTALANPDFANEIFSGGLNPKKVCMTCGLCGHLFGYVGSDGCPIGCVLRDSKIYRPYYSKYVRPKGKSYIQAEKMYPLKLFNLSSTPPVPAEDTDS